MIAVMGSEGIYLSGRHAQMSNAASLRGAAEIGAVNMPQQKTTDQIGTADGVRQEKSAIFGPAEFPYIPEGYGPEELAVRTRLAYPGLSRPDPARDMAGNEADTEEQSVYNEKEKSPAEEAEDAECETCKKRKYQDGSDDPGVSFKTATKVSPEMAASAVRGHEQEHVSRERVKAERENRKVISQTVTYHTGICPECGRFYVSGGTTRTVTASKPSKNSLSEKNSDNNALSA